MVSLEKNGDINGRKEKKDLCGLKRRREVFIKVGLKRRQPEWEKEKRRRVLGVWESEKRENGGLTGSKKRWKGKKERKNTF